MTRVTYLIWTPIVIVEPTLPDEGETILARHLKDLKRQWPL